VRLITLQVDAGHLQQIWTADEDCTIAQAVSYSNGVLSFDPDLTWITATTPQQYVGDKFFLLMIQPDFASFQLDIPVVKGTEVCVGFQGGSSLLWLLVQSSAELTQLKLPSILAK
jgi:hypothetical protein